MLYLPHKLFDKEKVQYLRKELLMSNEWLDGKNSAKGSQVKKNLQLNPGEFNTKLSNEIIKTIENDPMINNYSFPSKIFNILFSRTGMGMFYGPHVDSPYLETGRRDFSFTIFLNNPKEYEGGELVLYIPPEKKQIKMKEGEMIIYPTKYLHEVKEVTSGERMVCVGWIQSQIARDDDRESLTLMKTAMLEIIEKNGTSLSTQNLSLSFNNIYKRFLS